MTSADEIIDRRRIRRKLTFWRAVTFIVLVISLVGIIAYSASDSIMSARSTDHIARIKITGVITNDEPMLKLIDSLAKQDKIKAVVLNISSPGGSTVGGEAIYLAVRKLSEKKPVVTTVGTLAASAGYMVASATDHIVARRSSIVGSIGVLFQFADASELLKKIGVDVNSVKSSPLKAEPNPFTPASDEALAMIDRVIQDTYNWFVDIVAERRSLDRSYVVNTLADGSIFSGNQGKENGLVDAIGGEQVALDWLKSEKSISKDLKVIEYKPKRRGDNFFENPIAFQRIAKLFGIELSESDASSITSQIRHRILLDGLVSIWQVSDYSGGGNSD
ncbi:MAG: signal peptide peptidase SppA [Pseudomonadota bacterium]